ncbi:hypothetical protein [Candidatus Similichlamydia epinepheli]|uniref:hypothetical protein n=1 Tax=Candidatus Similichlamydia epinepheli TaxID=1903953 RepID=UPI00130053E3|nr:hypothetical protein [Candidatus Similichlamydia epinepheli]
MSNMCFFLHLASIFVKLWMLGITVKTIVLGTFCLSVFSLTLLLSWLFAYLLFDFNAYNPEIFDFPEALTDFLDHLLLCLNVLMSVWFFGFLAVPIMSQ